MSLSPNSRQARKLSVIKLEVYKIGTKLKNQITIKREFLFKLRIMV